MKSSRRRVLTHCVPEVLGGAARAVPALRASERAEAKVFILRDGMKRWRGGDGGRWTVRILRLLKDELTVRAWSQVYMYESRMVREARRRCHQELWASIRDARSHVSATSWNRV